MITEIDDPVIGKLTFDEYADENVLHWTRLEPLDLIGSDVSLIVQTDADGPTEHQRQVYLSLKSATAEMRAELQEALFEFYKVQRELYADACDDIEGYVEESLPVLESSDQIWGILDLLAWYIICPDSSIDMFGPSEDRCDSAIFWHGYWDIEHEFGVLFKDGKLQRIAGVGDF